VASLKFISSFEEGVSQGSVAKTGRRKKDKETSR
jgi:hypothetical protein